MEAESSGGGAFRFHLRGSAQVFGHTGPQFSQRFRLTMNPSPGPNFVIAMSGAGVTAAVALKLIAAGMEWRVVNADGMALPRESEPARP